MNYQISTNIRYLLWKRKMPREEWHSWLVRNTGLPETLTRALVQGTFADEKASLDQLHALARAFDLEEESENLRFADMVKDRENILLENLQYLFGNLPHGGKKVLAKEVGVKPGTVSRWLKGSSKPKASTELELVLRFGLPSETNLEEYPVFLSVHPVSHAERLRWLHERIDELSPAEFKDLYPAFRRMLRE